MKFWILSAAFKPWMVFAAALLALTVFFPNKRLSCVNINLHAFWPCDVGQVVILNELQYIVYTHQEY